MIFVPEAVLFKLISDAITALKTDYSSKGDKTTTLLYQMFYGMVIGKFNYYTQAVDLFSRDSTHPRHIETRLFFDAQRAELPTIHISLPGERSINDGIGVDAGYRDPVFKDATGTVGEDDFEIGTYQYTYTRRFEATYNIVITSDNTFEVLLVYHALRTMLISLFDSVQLSGFANPKLSGNDLMINEELVPPGVFFRAISINTEYEVDIPKYNVVEFFTDLTATGTTIAPDFST